MDICCNLHNNNECRLVGQDGTVCARTCPYAGKNAQIHCNMYVPSSFCDEGHVKFSSIEKRAAWSDVLSKAHAIVNTGGVSIIEENPQEIDAVVVSMQVAGDFPVYLGGPYDVILSKRSWENSKNTGGWIQGYLCSCAWGEYNSGQPGPRFQGRFCSHAMATLIVANARARKDFMGDRTANMKSVGECCECGIVRDDIDVRSGMCQDCHEARLFKAVVNAGWRSASKEDEEFICACEDCDLEDMLSSIECVDIDEKTKLVSYRQHKAVITADDCSFGVTASVYPVRYQTEGDEWSDYEYTVMVDADSPEEAMQKVKDEYGDVHCEVLPGDGVYDSFEDYDAKKPHNNRHRISGYDELFGESESGDYNYIVDQNDFGGYDCFVGSKDPNDTRIIDECGANYKSFDSEHEAVRWGEDCMVLLGSKTAQTIKLSYSIITNCGEVYLDYQPQFGTWGLFPGELFAEEFDMDPDPDTGGAFDEVQADDIHDAAEAAIQLLEYDWGVTVDDVKIGSLKTSSIEKGATRTFTFAEMQELEDEIEGRDLHNTDRFKTI